jgi:hypothetical protein
LDENVPHELGKALDALGMTHALSRDLVGRGRPDDEVMAYARSHGLVVVTENKRDFQQARTSGPAYLFLYKLGAKPSAALTRFRDVFLAACAAPPVCLELRDGSAIIHRSALTPAAPIAPVPKGKKGKQKKRDVPQLALFDSPTPPGSESPPAASSSS